jgi:hypothetical protein
MKIGRWSRLAIVLCCCVLFCASCAHMFRLDKGPITPGCLLDAPYCAYKRQDSVGAGLGWASLAALSWPWFVFAVAAKGRVDDCHARGGHWVCVGNNCNCVTVN